MTEDTAKRRKDAQADFPLRNNQTNVVMGHSIQHHHHQNGSLRNGIQQQQRFHPQQQQQHTRTSPALSCNSSRVSGKKQQSLGGGASINSSSASSTNNIHPTPLFQRLVSEEVQELKAYARIIESQNRRLAEMERVHGDLESRLEMQSNRRMELERTLGDRERNWAEQIDELKKEREDWKKLVNVERMKNTKLMDQVARKDQDIHRMLQRKYDQKRNNEGTNNAPMPMRNGGPRAINKSPLQQQTKREGASSKNSLVELDGKHESPHVILNANGSCEDVRERNVTNVLLDFFGIDS